MASNVWIHTSMATGRSANREKCRFQGYQLDPIHYHKINNFLSLICILIARGKMHIPPHLSEVFLYLCDNLCDVSCIASLLLPLVKGVIATSLAQLIWVFFLISTEHKEQSKPAFTVLQLISLLLKSHHASSPECL